MRILSLLFGLIAALLLARPAPAEEATRPEGRRLNGRLEVDRDGRARFLPATGRPVPLVELQSVRFPPLDLPPSRTGVFHRALLEGGQQVTGELLGLDGESLRLRTAWADRLVLPRRAVRGVVQPNGLVAVLDEDFETEPKDWKLTGSPALSDQQHSSGQRSLRLNTAGQRAEYRLPSAITEGQLGINVHLPESPSGLRWRVEAEFAGPDGPRTLAVQVAGGDGWKTEAPFPAEESARLSHRPGWQRLSLRFHPSLLVIGVDGKLLWSSGKQGPGGPLRAVRLVCLGTGEGSPKGEVFFDEVNLLRQVEEAPRRIGDPAQEEVWLRDGDQAFGQVLRADRRVIEVEAASGKRSVRWAEARGIFLRGAPRPCRTTEGEHVRVWFRSGAGGEPDRLDGVLRSLDARHLILAHADLGAMKLDRARLHRVSATFSGKRIVVENGLLHLGEKGQRAPGLPAADGPEVRRTFRLDAVPGAARLVIAVAWFNQTDGARTEVIVNGKAVGRLERHLDRVDGEPRSITLALPPGCLRAGENVVQLRRSPANRAGCGIAGLALEIPR